MSKSIFKVLTALAFFISCSTQSLAAPYAAVVMDARDGKVLFSQNGTQQLHPASLTKMMTLYIAFAEVSAGRISLEQNVTISSNAASKPPSKIGLRAGSTMKFKYLLRAAAIKSANDAATAIAEAIAGSESNFAVYMTQTASQLGMRSSSFKNAHGLTQSGHYSTANDMAILGRHIIYDYPEFYNLFSRESAQTPLGSFGNSNIRFLKDYPGADGIKTGYTRAAGYNLVATAERGRERVLVSMFGGQSSYQRNQQVGALLDLGFQRAPSSVKVSNISRPRLSGVRTQAAPAAVAQPEAKAPTPKATTTTAAVATKAATQPVAATVKTTKNYAPAVAARPVARIGVPAASVATSTATSAPSVAKSASLSSTIARPASRPSGLSTAMEKASVASVASETTQLAASIARPVARP